MSVKKSFKSKVQHLTAEERILRNEQTRFRDEQLDLHRAAVDIPAAKFQHVVFGMTLFMTVLMVGYPVMDAMLKYLDEKLLEPMVEAQKAKALRNKRNAELQAEEKEREAIKESVRSQLKLDEVREIGVKMSPELRLIYEKNTKKVEAMWMERGKNSSVNAPFKGPFMKELKEDYYKSKSDQWLGETFLKIDWLVEDFSKADYEKAELVWKAKLARVKKEAQGMTTVDKLWLLINEFIPPERTNTVHASFIEPVLHDFEAEYTTCFGYSRAIVSAAPELFPGSVDDLYFQFFGDHVRPVIFIEGKSYALDASGLSYLQDSLTRDYSSKLVRARDWIAILAGHDKKEFLIQSFKGAKDDNISYSIKLDSKAMTAVDVGGGTSPINSAKTYYSERGMRGGKEKIYQTGNQIRINSPVLDDKTVAEIIALGIKVNLKTLAFSGLKKIDIKALKKLRDFVNRKDIEVWCIAISIGSLDKQEAEIIADLRVSATIFMKRFKKLDKEIATIFGKGRSRFTFVLRNLDKLDKEEVENLLWPFGRVKSQSLEIDLENSQFSNLPFQEDRTDRGQIHNLILSGLGLEIKAEVMETLANYNGFVQMEDVVLSKDAGLAFKPFKSALTLDERAKNLPEFLEGVSEGRFMLHLLNVRLKGNLLEKVNEFKGQLSLEISEDLEISENAFEKSQAQTISLVEGRKSEDFDRHRILSKFLDATENYSGQYVGFTSSTLVDVDVQEMKKIARLKSPGLSLLINDFLPPEKGAALAKFPGGAIQYTYAKNYPGASQKLAKSLLSIKDFNGKLEINFNGELLDLDVAQSIVKLIEAKHIKLIALYNCPAVANKEVNKLLTRPDILPYLRR